MASFHSLEHYKEGEQKLLARKTKNIKKGSVVMARKNVSIKELTSEQLSHYIDNMKPEKKELYNKWLEEYKDTKIKYQTDGFAVWAQASRKSPKNHFVISMAN